MRANSRGDLAGGVAITGGARGIGRATALRFLESGVPVVIGDIDLAIAEKTATELSNLGDIHALAVDVRSRASFSSFLTSAEELVGPLDVLVNNAGIMPTGLYLEESEAMTDQMLDVNLRGVLNGSRLAGERFAARGHGHIVNIASLAGVSAYAGVATYSATKHAVVGFTAALRRELAAQGVGVTAVLPGVVRTELSDGAEIPSWAERLTTVDPEDVAAAVVDCVGATRGQVTVPTVLGVTLRVMSFLPTTSREAVERLTRLDRAFVVSDNSARRRYHERLKDQTS